VEKFLTARSVGFLKFANRPSITTPNKMPETRKKLPQPTLPVAKAAADAAAGLQGRAVLVPSTALAVLEERHGPDVFLHGTIKVPYPYNNCALLVQGMRW